MRANGGRTVVGLLPAAGMARRLGIDSPKELLTHRGRPVIDWSVDHLLQSGCARIVVVSRPGKEAVVERVRHLAGPFETEVVDVVQHGPIGNLLHALTAAARSGALGDHDVRLLFPDTCIEPNPFAAPSAGTSVVDEIGGVVDVVDVGGGGSRGGEILLHCHDAGDRWANFGVVDPVAGVIVEKPATFRGTICWGAATWTPAFSARLADAPADATLTDVINAARWRHRLVIERYEDIGLGALTPR